MKKMISTIIFFVTILLFATGCNNLDHSSAVEQELSEDTSEEELVNAQLEGDFTVTIRELLPDYVYDQTTLLCAVVTYFQDGPFIMYIGEEAANLEIGEQYTFTIESTPIGMVSKSDIGKEISYLDAQVNYQRVNITSFRKATEDELGLGGRNIQISEIE